MSLLSRVAGAVSLLVVSSLTFGCAGVQVVQQTPRGGVVDLGHASDDARAKAEDLMRAQCPFGYRIVDEQETRIAYACKDATSPSTSGPAAGVREVGVSI